MFPRVPGRLPAVSHLLPARRRLPYTSPATRVAHLTSGRSPRASAFTCRPRRCGARSRPTPSPCSRSGPSGISRASFASPRASSRRPRGETAGERPGARGNIEGRRRAYLVDAGLRPHGRRCACCGSRNVAVARPRARSGFGRDAETRGMHGWFWGQWLPGDPRSCACPAMNPGARENQCALAQAVRRRSHSNEENH